MRVLVNGLGNIGTTVAHLLLKYQKEFGIDEVVGCKRTLNKWNESDFQILVDRGMKLISYNKDFDSVIEDVDYIFECTSNGVGLNHLNRYKNLNNLKGASAQGSEKGFGLPFMSGINNEQIRSEKFVNVVSCNTHGSASLLKLFGGDNFSNIQSADFVVVRRSEDIGQHERLVSANVVARHLDDTIGTHHCIDVVDLFKTINVNIPLTSSDVTTPSQMLHAVRFNIELNNALSKQEIDGLLDSDPYVSVTNKFDSNVVFELGRRYGEQGRLFSHTIVVHNNLLINRGAIKGWAFVPQEGNTIISTLHAFLLQTDSDDSVHKKILTDLIRKNW